MTYNEDVERFKEVSEYDESDLYHTSYDDFIFVISVIYASNIDLNIWIRKLETDTDFLKYNIMDASVVHCLDWLYAIEDIIDFANDSSIPIDPKMRYKDSYQSRIWVNDNITPILIPILDNTGTITNDDVIKALKSTINKSNNCISD